MMISLDDLLEHIGITRGNVLYFAVASLVPAVLPLNLIGGEFLNPPPTFVCCDEVANLTDVQNNSTQNECWVPSNNVSGSGEDLTPCQSFCYNTSLFHTTIAMQWDLVCDRTYLRPLYQTIYSIGSFFGALIGGVLADRYGRRCAVRVGAIFTCILSLALAATPWLFLVFFCRFFLGVFNTVMIYPAFLLGMESCPPSLRPIVGIMVALPYALMTVVLSGFAYFIREWRQLQLALSFPAFILLPVAIWVEESPRWLLLKGQLEDTCEVLLKSKGKMASGDKQNGGDVNQNDKNAMVLGYFPNEHELSYIVKSIYEQQFLSGNEVNKTYLFRWLELFKNSTMRRITVTLIIIWFCQAVVYLGIPLSSERFSSPFLYLAMIGLMEFPAYSLMAPLTRRYGRKSVAIPSLAASGLCILLACLSQIFWTPDENLTIALVTIGYGFICTSYQVNFLFAPELMPTSLRPYGTCLLSLVAYIGFSVPSFITDLLADDYPWLPSAIFAICAGISCISLLFLPETKGLPLPENISHIKNLVKKKNLDETIASPSLESTSWHSRLHKSDSLQANEV